MAEEIIDQSGFTAALDAGKQLACIDAEPVSYLVNESGAKIECKPFVVVPEGCELKDASHLLLDPQRIKAKAAFTDLASFIAYVNKFQEDGTLLLADLKGCSVKAELDYHEPTYPHARLHSAGFTAEKSREWNAWIALHERVINQMDLYQFLHANRRDIREPDAAHVLEAIRNLKLTENVVYERAENLRNGEVQLKYTKSVDDRAKGEMVIPTEFTVELRPFTNADPVRIKLELRYRLNNDKLTFTLVFDRPDLVIEETFLTMLARVHDETSFQPLLGKIE